MNIIKSALVAFLTFGFFGTPAKADGISAGDNFVVSVEKGTLLIWDNNEYGQSGLGDRRSRQERKQVGRETNWKMASAGRNFVVAIKTDGTFWKMDYTSKSRETPTQIGKSNNWKMVSAEDKSFLALTIDGKLFAWGNNFDGQLGLGNKESQYDELVRVGKNNDWKFVAAGKHSSFAIKQNGWLYGFGRNWCQELGIERENDNQLSEYVCSPTRIGKWARWQQVSVSDDFTLGIRGGRLYAWGRGASAAKGDDQSTYALTAAEHHDESCVQAC